MNKKIIIGILTATFSTFTVCGWAQVLSPRQAAAITDEIIGERLNQLVPQLMDKHGFDMWILVCREYNEDPVVKTMLPATWLSARRRTILVFYRNSSGNVFEKLAIARYNIGEHIKSAWDWQRFPNQWDALVDMMVQRNPRNIGLNFSTHHAHADGLTYTEHKELIAKLPQGYGNRIKSAEPLAIGWLETRLPRELMYYEQVVQMTHAMIAEAFSEKVITPGVTTTDDVVWWFRQYMVQHGVQTWFHPTVDVQRSDAGNREYQRSFSERPKPELIQPGDLLHCDVGISWLGLHSDIQQLAYVLKPGETEVPDYLTAAFAKGLQLQDILTASFKTGITGNEILKTALQKAKTAGINPSIYTHPIGLHGHAAGPTIGLWDMQAGVPGPGDYPLYPNTCYSIELNASVEVPQWNKYIRIMLEENGCWDGEKFTYLHGRQKEIYTIPRLAGRQ